MKVTVRAAFIEEGGIGRLPAHGASRIQHVLPFPVAACPVSRNPVEGTVTVTYMPRAGHVLEVVSLMERLQRLCAPAPGNPQSVEEVARALANICARTAEVRVRVHVDVTVLPGPQQLRVTCMDTESAPE